MPSPDQLSERELRVLEAVVQTYIETAEPAGSQTIARRFGLGVSPATIRNTMSELEDKGYLFHPHTSAGRIPTDRAYRVYVNEIMRLAPPSRRGAAHAQAELVGSRNAVEEILRRAAQVLGVLTQELGVAVAPALDEMVLERLELVPVSSERLLLVFNLRSGIVRTIFVEVPGRVAAGDRARGRPDPQRAARRGTRCSGSGPRCPSGSGTPAARDGGRELLNIFIAEGEGIFDLSDEPERGGAREARRCWPSSRSSPPTRACASCSGSPRGATCSSRRSRRADRPGSRSPSAAENPDARLTDFTLVTASYEAGASRGSSA